MIEAEEREGLEKWVKSEYSAAMGEHGKPDSEDPNPDSEHGYPNQAGPMGWQAMSLSQAGERIAGTIIAGRMGSRAQLRGGRSGTRWPMVVLEEQGSLFLPSELVVMCCCCHTFQNGANSEDGQENTRK